MSSTDIYIAEMSVEEKSHTENKVTVVPCASQDVKPEHGNQTGLFLSDGDKNTTGLFPHLFMNVFDSLHKSYFVKYYHHNYFLALVPLQPLQNCKNSASHPNRRKK